MTGEAVNGSYDHGAVHQPQFLLATLGAGHAPPPRSDVVKAHLHELFVTCTGSAMVLYVPLVGSDIVL